MIISRQPSDLALLILLGKGWRRLPSQGGRPRSTTPSVREGFQRRARLTGGGRTRVAVRLRRTDAAARPARSPTIRSVARGKALPGRAMVGRDRRRGAPGDCGVGSSALGNAAGILCWAGACGRTVQEQTVPTCPGGHRVSYQASNIKIKNE